MSVEGGTLGTGHGGDEVIARRVHEKDPFAHTPILLSQQPALRGHGGSRPPAPTDAEVQHDETGAASATALAAQLAAERQRLEACHARYERWATDTHGTRETAGKARSELHRRGQAQPDGEPQAQPDDESQTTAGWWREFDADLQAAERAIARRHQSAIDAGESWPPPTRTRAGSRADSGG